MVQLLLHLPIMTAFAQERLFVAEYDLIDGSGEVNAVNPYSPDYIRNVEDLNEKLSLLGLGKKESGKDFTQIQKLLFRLHRHHPGSLVHSLSVLELVGACESNIEVKKAAALHDIEKASVPANILRKPSGLTEEEYDEIKKHTYAGWLRLTQLGFSSTVTAGALSHHIKENVQYGSYPVYEKLHGGGCYIAGVYVSGLDFQLSRKIALADALDAMTRVRAYTIPKPVNESEAILRREIEMGVFGDNREYIHSVLTSMISVVDDYYRVIPLYDSAALWYLCIWNFPHAIL